MTTYSNPRMAAVIDNWPIGGKRCTATFNIECHATRGQRAVRTTVGTPKRLTYAEQMRIVDGDDGRTYIIALAARYGFIVVYCGDMKYAHETVYERDPRHPELFALFGDYAPAPAPAVQILAVQHLGTES